MWARHIIFVSTHRFLRSRTRLSMLKLFSDISVICTQNGGQNESHFVRQSLISPISSLTYGLES